MHKTRGMIKAEAKLGRPIEDAICESLIRNQNSALTASELGISRTALWNWMHILNIPIQRVYLPTNDRD